MAKGKTAFDFVLFSTNPQKYKKVSYPQQIQIFKRLWNGKSFVFASYLPTAVNVILNCTP